MSLEQIVIASCQYPVEFLTDWAHFERKLESLFQLASEQGAQLLVFPEYAAMELASLFPAEIYRSLSGQLEAIQDLLDNYLAVYRRLAERHGVYCLTGSFPVRVADGYRNRAYLIAPDGSIDFQEKMIMTRFENEQWGISPGVELKVFATALGTLAVNICYDSEFPLLARAQVEAGAELILAPSCTDTFAGYHRVKIGCQARALENQCHVVQASLVGEAEWSEAVDVNTGASAIYTPVDHGFPSNGILAIGELDQPGWVVATVQLAQARAIREHGQVFNHRDWPRQYAAARSVSKCTL